MGILLSIHVLAGTIALLCAALAVSSEKGKKFHVLSGRTYFWCMVGIFLTAIPMSIINSNTFLFLIAIFSFYLAFAGMRFAKNRKMEFISKKMSIQSIEITADNLKKSIEQTKKIAFAKFFTCP